MRFILTFGSDHLHPDTGASLFGRFCVVEDESEDAARLQAERIFGRARYGPNYSRIHPYSETGAKRPGIFPTPRERCPCGCGEAGMNCKQGDARLYERLDFEWTRGDTLNTHVHICSEHEYSVTHTEDECRPTVTCPEGCVI